MKAIAIDQSKSATESDCFAELTLDLPTVSSRDLLVKVKAISVNPVDYKVRSSVQSGSNLKY